MDRQLISEEDTFLWLSKGDLKAETERNSGSTRPSVKHEVLRHKNTTQRWTANADCANNMMRQ